VMQEALERACRELDIQRGDKPNRMSIAFLIAGSTRAGVHDLDGLTSRVVAQFKIKL